MNDFDSHNNCSWSRFRIPHHHHNPNQKHNDHLMFNVFFDDTFVEVPGGPKERRLAQEGHPTFLHVVFYYVVFFYFYSSDDDADRYLLQPSEYGLIAA